MNIDSIIADTLIDFNARLWITNTRSFNGRIFRETKDDMMVPTIATAETDKYIEVFKDKKFDAQCFFDVMPDAEQLKMMEKNTVRAMFMVNLIKLYPTNTRIEATELAKKEALNLLTCNFDMVGGFVSGRNAFSDYKFSDLDISDMSPNYLFRYDCTSYNTNC